jgi:hypothetical protein
MRSKHIPKGLTTSVSHRSGVMRRSNHTTAWVIALSATFLVGGWSGVQAEEAQFGTPKGSEGRSYIEVR